MVQEYWDRCLGQAVRQMVSWDRGGMLPSVRSSCRAAQGRPGGVRGGRVGSEAEGPSAAQRGPAFPLTSPRHSSLGQQSSD